MRSARWLIYSMDVMLLSALILLSTAGGAVAADLKETMPEVKVISLERAQEIAAVKNRDIEKAREYISYVKGRYIEERASALPQLSTSFSLGQDRDESLKMYSPMQTERTDRRSVKLGFTQALFTWGQLSAAIRAAEVGMASAETQLHMARHAVRLAVSSAFYDVLLAREFIQLSRQNLEQKKRHLDEARRRYQAGVATDYDILAAEVSTDNARPETVRAENAHRSARDALRFLLAMEQGDVDVLGSLESGAAQTVSYEKACDAALKKRPDLADLRLRIRMYEEKLTVMAAQNKPRIDMKGEYGWNYLEQPGLHGDGPAWNLGIQLSYPFFDGMRTEGRAMQAGSELKSLRIEEARMIDRISLEVRDSISAVRESEEILGALTGTVVQAERLLVMAERGYALGVKTRIDVEDAELNLQQAKVSFSRARRDVLVARAKLDWVTGADDAVRVIQKNE
jgi:HAE1 family hydrophobic/amphiphilic exporter-1